MSADADAAAPRREGPPEQGDRLRVLVDRVWPRESVGEAAQLVGCDEESARSRATAARELSSPACSAHEADAAYMGYADQAELVAFLNELLEAARAGARATLRTALALGDGGPVELMRGIHQDEARWCAMLLRHIKALGEMPSSKVGAFYGKAMAIADLSARLAFLNRGQDWVVRRLREMLPRVRDDALHSDLADMLRSHEANIARASAAAGRPS